jgi:hypothetical protein
MANISLPNRPVGSDTRVIAQLLADFDAILAQANGNLQASTNVKVGIAASALDGNTAAEGSSDSLARADHKHLIQGVERLAAQPGSGHFVGRLYFNTTTVKHMLCIEASIPTYVPIVVITGGGAGSVLYISASAQAFTASPSDSQVLRSVASVPTWKTVERVKVRRAAAQSIADSNWTFLLFDTEDRDTDSMWVVGSPSRLTINTAGDYWVSAGWSHAAAAGLIGVRIKKNNVVQELRASHAQAAGGEGRPCVAGLLTGLAVADYLEVEVFQSSGGSQNTLTALDVQPYASAVRVG